MEQPFEIFDFKDEAEWLNGRMNGIGGSDASAVIGMNPYKSNIDLFEEKIGRRFPEDISGKACVIYGKHAEEPIRELFKLDYPEYKVEHHEFRILRSIEHPFMQASLDGELTDQKEEKESWKYSSFWFKDFDGMALKTMLRQLISKWGIMSIDLQTALDKDMAVIHEDGTTDYVDTQPEQDNVVADQELQEVKENKKEQPTGNIEEEFFQ